MISKLFVVITFYNFILIYFVHTQFIFTNESNIANRSLINCIRSENYDISARPYLKTNSFFKVNVSILITDIRKNVELMVCIKFC